MPSVAFDPSTATEQDFDPSTAMDQQKGRSIAVDGTRASGSVPSTAMVHFRCKREHSERVDLRLVTFLVAVLGSAKTPDPRAAMLIH